jgi:hypothetical protein
MFEEVPRTLDGFAAPACLDQMRFGFARFATEMTSTGFLRRH